MGAQKTETKLTGT